MNGIRMNRESTISVTCALLLTVTGCERSSQTVHSEPAKTPEETDLDRRADIAEGWIRDADVVAETIDVPRGMVRIIKPRAGSGTNRVIQFGAVREALGEQNRSTAVLIVPKNVDNENMTNAVAALKEARLTVRIVFFGWGRRFPGPQM
jgi:hypothetical protein